ncbi:MAG TPA: O-acetyl-ADP-ribose deacetylase [Candidatus Latescibacteria bacterium]|nr:O-acetyl-ADP-ribose deacetylase [Candidatus Latescibacterota bacterium]
MKPAARMELFQGDITSLAVEAIVNAANESLLGGGGVDGAIHRAAGPELLAECRGLGGCPTGEARVTAGYRLSAAHIIHTVGPVYSGSPRVADLLASCYRNSLLLAAEGDFDSIAFPAISCGTYAYPLREASQVAVRATRDFLAQSPTPRKVIFALFSPAAFRAYEDALAQIRS